MLVALALLLLPLAWAQLQLTPVSCLVPASAAPSSQLLNLTRTYAQFDQGQTRAGQHVVGGFAYNTRPTLYGPTGPLTGRGDVLRLMLVGTTGTTSEGFSNVTNFVAALESQTSTLTFAINANQSALCSAIRPPGGAQGDSGCPYGPGEIALGLSIPLESSYPLATLSTRITVLDSSVPPLTLACYDIDLTPFYPAYFAYSIIHFFPIALLAFYLALHAIARMWAAHTDFIHEHETQLASSLTLKLSGGEEISRRERLGAIWFAAWSGKQLVGSGSLRRFCTAEFRELWNTVAWFSLVGVVGVQWPAFAYPIFSQTAWTTLIYNSTLPFVSPRPSTLFPSSFIPPAAFATQIRDVSSPLYLDSAVPDVLLDLGGASPGIESWARMVGIEAADLFSTCLFTFVVLLAIVTLGHLLVAGVDTLLDLAIPGRKETKGAAQVHPLEASKTSKAYSGKETFHASVAGLEDDIGDPYGEREAEEYPREVHPSWKLHLSLLQGNLTRLLLLFHLPLSIFSIYQLSLHRTSPTSSLVLASFSLVIFSLLLPAAILYRVYSTPLRTLYHDTTLLLSVGPLYNIYSDECTLFTGTRFASNFVLGIVLGGVRNGTAQAAVILVVEVVDTLLTSLWLPWGDGAVMGPLAFLLSLARIIIAVLLIILSPAVSISTGAAEWLAYVIFLVQGLIGLALLFILLFKTIELGVRGFGGVPFDESRSPRVGGLFGALRRMDRSGIKQGTSLGGRHSNTSLSNAAAIRRRLSSSYPDARTASFDTIGTTARMLPPRSGHRSRESSTMSTASYDHRTQPSLQGSQRGRTEEDGGFIMSAMSSGSWSVGNTGYIPPAAYSTVPQPLSPRFFTGYEAEASGSQSGFARVGGGRASVEKPYQLSGQPEEYRPAPSTSTAGGLYGTSRGLSPTTSKNRQSQSAMIELAGGESPDHRPIALPASTSGLLSNSRRSSSGMLEEISPSATGLSGGSGKGKGKGFLGFRRRKTEDVSSDEDTEEDDDVPKQRRWLPMSLGRGKNGKGREEEQEPTKREFVVVRKARPKTSPTSSALLTTPTTATVPLPSSTEPTGRAAPHLSVEPPSPTGLADASDPHAVGTAATIGEDFGTEGDMARLRQTLG